jgi:nucleoid-associated protein YgaU
MSTITDQKFAIRYYYTITASTGNVVTVLRGQSPPKITGGVGGWEIVPRRRRKGMTSWQGRDPISMDLPILFDGHGIFPVDQDPDISMLRLMAVGDNFQQPPTVTIVGFTPAQGVVWVINDIEWGDDVVWETDPNTGDDIRTRQDASLKLLQFVQVDTVKVIPTAGVPGIWTVEKGQTLRTIAKESYGNASYWTLIRDANPNVRDPENVPVGTELRIPPKPTKAQMNQVNPGHPDK